MRGRCSSRGGGVTPPLEVQTEVQFAALNQRGAPRLPGLPVATIASFGPDNQFASKVAVGIVVAEGEDVRFDWNIAHRDRFTGERLQ